MDRGQIVLVDFPYSDLRGRKRRPACVVSVSAFNTGPEVVLAMVTSSRLPRDRPGLGDVVLRDWKAAGLLRPSVIRAGKLFVPEQHLVKARLGLLTDADRHHVDRALREVLGI